MTSTSRICYLKCIKNIKPKIDLPNGQPVILGRNSSTEIQDKTLSRKQIIATANTETHQVTIRTVGSVYSGCNGYALRKGSTYTLTHGDLIELRLGYHEYEINFEPPPNLEEPPSNSEDPPPDLPEEPPVKKLKHNFPIFDNDRKKVGDGIWENIDNRELLIFTSPEVRSSSKIAGFDMDGTLIKTKSGARFAKTLTIGSLAYRMCQGNCKSCTRMVIKLSYSRTNEGLAKIRLECLISRVKWKI